MNEEQWRNINGFDGYKISNFGRVCSAKNNSGKILNKYKIIKSSVRNGYLIIGLRGENKRKEFFVHRLVALHFIDNPENKPMVAHLDGTRDNAHFSNLVWATAKENSFHMIAHGTRCKITGRPFSLVPTKNKMVTIRLNEKDKEMILALYKSVQAFFDKSLAEEKSRHGNNLNLN